MKKVLVTGAAGFIGHHLVKNLLADGYNVYAVDNLSSPAVDLPLMFKDNCREVFPAFINIYEFENDKRASRIVFSNVNYNSPHVLNLIKKT